MAVAALHFGGETMFAMDLNLFGGSKAYRRKIGAFGLEKGDSLSFDEFFAAEFPAVYRAVYLYTAERELSEDAAQESFAKAYTKWSSLQAESWAKGWIIRTAINVAKRRLKREWLLRRRISSSRTTTSSASPSADRVLLVDALKQLPERQREAVVLFYIGDLSVVDVAASMRISAGAVKAHLSNARPRLRHVLEVGDD